MVIWREIDRYIEIKREKEREIESVRQREGGKTPNPAATILLVNLFN